MKNELVIVLDFGGQYNQLVARRVRECNVYCEIYSYKTDIEKIKAMNPKGIILTGGPNSCYLPDSPTYTEELFKLGIPVLGLVLRCTAYDACSWRGSEESRCERIWKNRGFD